MLTIFAIPKAFQGHFNIIQRNAIKSWLLLRPKCDIILFGDEQGTAEIANEFKIRHIPEIARNNFGTPLLNGVFAKAQKLAKYQKMAYVNADIILMSDFMKAVQSIKISSYLMIGQRMDVEIKKMLQFNNIDWEKKLKFFVKKYGELHGPTGIDYFVFPRGFYQNIPSFAIGRPVWDNWLIYKTRFFKFPVIDATGVVRAVHQNHEYAHPQGAEGLWRGPEAKENLKLAGGLSHVFMVEDADWFLTLQGIKKRKLIIKNLYRYCEILLILFSDRKYWSNIVSILLFPCKISMAMIRKIK